MRQTATQRRQKHQLQVGLCLLLASFLVACGETSKHDRQVILGEKPVAEIRLLGGKPYVELEPGETLRSVVDLSLFAGFEPDTTPEEAERMHGLPESIRTRHANTYYNYRVAGARVELARLLIQSEGEEAIKWELTAFPNAQQPLNSFVDASITGQLKPDLTGVVIMESGDGESANFQIEDGAVVWIYWSGPDHGLRQ